MLNLDIIRRAVVLCSLFILAVVATAQTSDSTLHISGSKLIGICGDTIVLRGVNYAPYNWGYDSSQLQLSEVAKTGANAVRMSWYAHSAAPYYTDALLDSAIGTCIKNKMIPIIELHDYTCDATIGDIETLSSWYTAPARVAIFHKYQSSLIINLANEAGYVNWATDTYQAGQDYQNAYNQLIYELRQANIKVPFMVDAPDCGTSIDAFVNVAFPILTSDPIQNLIFSAHAYWFSYANNDSGTIAHDINSAASYSLPLVIGEVANYQDDAGTYCTFSLNYSPVLRACLQQKLGWLVWSWDNDQCTGRQLSTNGSFDSLSVFGRDIINNSAYGLLNVAKRTKYLSNGGCTNTTGVEDLAVDKPYILYNDNGTAYLKSLSDATMQIRLFDMVGREVYSGKINSGQIIPLLTTDMGLVQVKDKNDRSYVSKFVSVK